MGFQSVDRGSHGALHYVYIFYNTTVASNYMMKNISPYQETRFVNVVSILQPLSLWATIQLSEERQIKN
jgi:hypothetical protein